jgi:hypothetical protein
VPLSFAWDEQRIILATEPSTVTAHNIERSRVARIGFGETRDVVMIDATLEAIFTASEVPIDLSEAYARQTDWDPRSLEGDFAYLALRPDRIQAWREADEIAGRTLMRGGSWLI